MEISQKELEQLKKAIRAEIKEYWRGVFYTTVLIVAMIVAVAMWLNTI